MRTLCLVAILGLLPQMTMSCKKKNPAESKKLQVQDSSANGPSVPAGEWRGQEDQIDPSLGKLKALD